MMQLAAYGRLGQDPRAIDTRTGKSMTVASIAVDMSNARDGEEREQLQVVADSLVSAAHGAPGRRPTPAGAA